MYRKYYSMNDMPQMVKKQDSCEDKPTAKKCEEKCETKKVLGNLDLDDVILGIVILAILLDDSEDTLLLLALLAVFLTGHI